MDPLLTRYEDLAGEESELMKVDLLKAVPQVRPRKRLCTPHAESIFIYNATPTTHAKCMRTQLEKSPFFKAIADMLVDDGTGPAGKAGAIPKKTFIRVLARFSAGAPIEPKIRGMFDMFRNAGGGGGASLGDDRLSRSGVTSLMNALYSQESETMIEVMVTGLMQGVGVRAALRTVSLTVLDSTAGLTTGHSPHTPCAHQVCR